MKVLTVSLSFEIHLVLNMHTAYYSNTCKHVRIIENTVSRQTGDNAGSYTKEDIASGLVELFCLQFAKFGVQNARMCKLKSVVYLGSFVASALVRESLARWFLVFSMLQPLLGVSFI